LVLVEGESDAAAVRALANLIGFDLARHHVELQSANGVTNYSRALSAFVLAHPDAGFCGLYDVADERHVRQALSSVGAPIADDASVEPFGFFACTADLEEELIRALGAASVERVIEEQGELASFRRFQAMPQHRGTPVHQQLRRFLGTRATRKVRSAQRLVEALAVDRLPPPLAGLAARLRDARSTGGAGRPAAEPHRCAGERQG
jgi:hypothetical protein